MKSNGGAYQRLSQGTDFDSDSNVVRATPIVVTGTIVSNHSVVPQPQPPAAAVAAIASSSASTSSPPTLYRTKCDLNTIPLVARDMTWTDPFYETISYHTEEIIAVFDIDRTVYNKMYMIQPVSIFMFLLLLFMFGIFFVFFIVIYLFITNRRSNMLRLQRTHIAITRNGIYIDEVDTPGSTNLMSRTLIKFSDIKQCKSITQYGWTEQSILHKIFLSTKDLRTTRFIVGIKQQQKFVDIVNAMMLQTTATTEAVPVATVEEQTNVETATSIATTSTDDVIAVVEIV